MVEELDRNSIKTQEDVNKKTNQRFLNRYSNMEEIELRISNDNEEAQDEKDNYCLDISHLIEIKIQLSTGGDGDGFKLYKDINGDIIKGCFYWEDWGVYGEYWLNNNELEFVNNFFSIDCYEVE